MQHTERRGSTSTISSSAARACLVVSPAFCILSIVSAAPLSAGTSSARDTRLGVPRRCRDGGADRAAQVRRKLIRPAAEV